MPYDVLSKRDIPLCSDIRFLSSEIIEDVERSSTPEKKVLGRLHSEGTIIELEEAKKRAKDLQLDTLGVQHLLAFVGAEKKIVKRMRKKSLQVVKKRQADEENILYGGKAGTWEKEKKVIDIKLPPQRVVMNKVGGTEEKEDREARRKKVEEYYKTRKDGGKKEKGRKREKAKTFFRGLAGKKSPTPTDGDNTSTSKRTAFKNKLRSPTNILTKGFGSFGVGSPSQSDEAREETSGEDRPEVEAEDEANAGGEVEKKEKDSSQQAAVPKPVAKPKSVFGSLFQKIPKKASPNTVKEEEPSDAPPSTIIASSPIPVSPLERGAASPATSTLKPTVLLNVHTDLSGSSNEGKEAEDGRATPSKISFVSSPVGQSPLTIEEDGVLELEGGGGDITEAPPPVESGKKRSRGITKFGGLFGNSSSLSSEAEDTKRPVRKRDKMKQTFVGFGKVLPSPKKTMFSGFGKQMKKTMLGGMKKMGNKIGIQLAKERGFSYQLEARKARAKWAQQEAMSKDELIRGFVKTAVVLGCIKVIQAKRREYVPSFSDKKVWKGAEEVKEEVKEEGKDEGKEENGKIDLSIIVDVDAPNSTVSLKDLYRAASFSPVHSVRAEDSEFSHRSEIEGQENFWSVVGRVFRPNKSKEVVKDEVILEEVVPEVKKVIVEKRIGYSWVERRTWIDEIIKISNDNYGGGDGGTATKLGPLVASPQD